MLSPNDTALKEAGNCEDPSGGLKQIHSVRFGREFKTAEQCSRRETRGCRGRLAVEKQRNRQLQEQQQPHKRWLLSAGAGTAYEALSRDIKRCRLHLHRHRNPAPGRLCSSWNPAHWQGPHNLVERRASRQENHFPSTKPSPMCLLLFCSGSLNCHRGEIKGVSTPGLALPSWAQQAEAQRTFLRIRSWAGTRQ